MNLSKTTRKMFVRSKIYIPVLLLLVGFIVYKMVKLLPFAVEGRGFDGILGSTIPLLKTSILHFVAFAFIAYEFGCACKRSKIAECLKSTKNGYPKFVLSQAGVLFFCVSALFAVQLICNTIICIVAKQQHLQYLVQSFLNCVLSFLLIPLVGMLLGLFLSQAVNRINSYLILVLVVLLGTPMVTELVGQLYDTSKINLFPFVNMFNPFPPSLDWRPTQAFGHSILPYRWAITGFWLFLLITLLALKLYDKQPDFKKQKLILPAALSVLCLIVLCLPQSKLILNSNDSFNSTIKDVYYYYGHYYGYEEKVIRNEAADFTVTKYDLDLSIGLELKTTAALTVDKTDLEEYHFTLYHGYTVKSVTDENNNKLNFEQDGDYLTVYNDNKNINTIIMKYRGHSNVCYSNVQGTYLPAHFAYYPRAGFEPVYDKSHQSYARITIKEPVDFNVSIHGIGKYYCNLEQTDKNTYSGVTNGLTVFSGLYDELEVDGVTVVYPYLNRYEYNENAIIDAIESHKGTDALKDNIKKMMVVADVENGSAYTNFAEYSDYITLKQIIGYDHHYERQLIQPGKAGLKTSYEDYLYRPDVFNMFISDEYGNRITQPPEKDNGATFRNYYMLKYIEELGEEEALARIEQYLNDDSDTRTYQQFFEDEMGAAE